MESMFKIANSFDSIDVVERVCGIKTEKGWFSSPFREDKNPSCQCTSNLNFTCRITDWGSQEKFTNINFVCKFFKLDPKTAAAEAAKMIINTLEGKTVIQKPEPAQSHQSYSISKDLSPILKRGISLEIIKEMKLAYDDKMNAILIPTYKDGKLYGVIKRNLDPDKPKYQNPRGFDASWYLYGLDHIRGEHSYLYVVEGWFDYLACRTAGINNVVALHTASMTDAQWEQINKFRLILALDNDQTGQEHQKDMISSRANVIGYVKYPKHCKDANDVLLQKGGKGLLKVFKKVKRVKFPIKF